MQTWETVQKLRQGKRRPASTGETSKYSGLLFCADCGSKLYFNHKRADDPKSYSFNCSHYRNNVKEKCTPHRIHEAVLDEILLEELRRITYTARTKERQFAEFVNKKSFSENRRELKSGADGQVMHLRCLSVGFFVIFRLCCRYSENKYQFAVLCFA